MTDIAVIDFQKTLTIATNSRMLIDMANSLDVAGDHLRVKAQRAGFPKRMLDAITGRSRQRDEAISGHQQTALRGLMDVTTQFARELTDTNLALVQVGNRLTYVENTLARTATEWHKKLQQLTDVVQSEFQRVDAQLQTLDMRVKANEQLRRVFNLWEAGALDALPLASRASAALQELRWGAVGQFLNQHPEEVPIWRKDIITEAIKGLRRDARLESGESFSLRDWLALPEANEQKTQTFLQGLDWLDGEEATLDSPQGALKLCSQWPLLEHQNVRDLPLHLRPMAAISAEHMAERLADAALMQLNADDQKMSARKGENT